MRIGLLGAGRMAEGHVPLWVAAGHDVLIGGRTPSRAQALAERVGARGGTLREAAELGDVAEDAKRAVATLVRDVGAEPLDVGGLEQAHNLEAMPAVIIRVLYGGADALTAFQLTVGTPSA